MRQTDRGRQTGRQTDRQTDRQDRQTDRQAGRQTDRQIDRQTDRHRQTEIETVKYTQFDVRMYADVSTPAYMASFLSHVSWRKRICINGHKETTNNCTARLACLSWF